MANDGTASPAGATGGRASAAGATAGKAAATGHARHGLHIPLPPTMSGYRPAWLGPDIVAGVTLAAVAIPECMGYTKIVGTPVVTGLYTILLPIAAFAIFGSSRHLVVGADSATAAILFAGLTGLAQPFSAPWLTLASTSALLTAAFLFLARIVRLGFLADFLSRTVLVGFLSGVGVSLLVGQLPEMLGVSVPSREFIPRLLGSLQALPQTHLPTLIMALSVLAVILFFEHFAHRVPGSLLAVVLAIVATWVFRLDQHGIAVVGNVQPGLPHFGLPRVQLGDVTKLIATSASMFLVILAQSAATSRSFAQKHGEAFDENRDLVGLGIANALAGFSQTFVVNGSPTKTAVVEAAGGHTQLAQLVTAVVTLAVLLFATGPIERLPNAALAAIVFLIGVKLIDVRGLRQIYHLQRETFVVAMVALLGVVFLGVERGIFLAIVLSVLGHLRREYHPKDIVLTTTANGHLTGEPARPGLETAPGLIVYRFESGLFFANADYFAARVEALIKGAPQPPRWFVFDLVSMSDLDYTAGLTLASTVADLQRQGITVALTEDSEIRPALDRFGITAKVGPGHIFDTVQGALDAYQAQAGTAPPPRPAAPAPAPARPAVPIPGGGAVVGASARITGSALRHAGHGEDGPGR